MMWDFFKKGTGFKTCPFFLCLPLFFFSGCASLGFEPLDVPPEFNQKVQLIVSDKYEMYQAPTNDYDLGDLQSFHSQHTFPIKVQGIFNELFAGVEMIEPGAARLDSGAPEVPAVFEVHMIDLGHDFFDQNEQTFRAEVTIAAAMKTPKGTIAWQKAFRGSGFTEVDNQFGANLGPEQAVIYAVDDALAQLQQEILKNPQVRLQMRYYLDIDRERSKVPGSGTGADG